MSKMEWNIDKAFATDAKSETEGVWFEIQEGVSLLVKRYGGSNSQTIKKAAAKFSAPYSRQIEKGTISPEKDLEIAAKTIVEACIIDWKGIQINGQDQEFKKELCVQLLMDFPELAADVFKFAANPENYKGDLGNY